MRVVCLPTCWRAGSACRLRPSMTSFGRACRSAARVGSFPLNLAVLPDFTLISDEEEREQAIDLAWATLVPLIRATGSTKDLKEGLLKDALRAFARHPTGGVDQFIRFLADLPEGVSKLTKAQKLASDMSDQLIAKIAVNPLLNAPGEKRFLVTYLAPASVIDDWKRLTPVRGRLQKKKCKPTGRNG